MGVCLSENSLMMVMENWGKSKRRMLDFGCWILVVGRQETAGSFWVPPEGAPFRCGFSPFKDDFGGSVGSFCNPRMLGGALLALWVDAAWVDFKTERLSGLRARVAKAGLYGMLIFSI
jgi:hypothetical protein